MRSRPSAVNRDLPRPRDEVNWTFNSPRIDELQDAVSYKLRFLALAIVAAKKKNVHAEVLEEGAVFSDEAARNMAPTIDMMANGALK